VVSHATDQDILDSAVAGSFACGTEPTVGESQAANGELHAFLWENGVMRDLGTLGGSLSRARGINNQGKVVGWGLTAGGATRAFLWDNGVMTRLNITPFARAFAINAGLIVGDHRNSEHPPQAFVLKNGAVIGLGTFGGTRSLAADVNLEGKVVGWANTASGAERAFLWQNGEMRNLGTLGGKGSIATGISPLGHVVGFSNTSSGASHGFLWQNGVMSDLGPGAPSDINRAGWIVGILQNSSGSNRATLWKPISE
jgi:probable HAF family extracellular repeat protein